MKLSEEISQKRWNFGWNFRENDELVIEPDIPTNDEEAIAARFDHPWDTALCG